MKPARRIASSAVRRWVRSAHHSARPRTALFFPGQGVQRVGMITPWLDAFPSTVKPILEETDSILQLPLSRIIAEGPNSVLTETPNAQPGIMATSIIILRVLEREFGFTTSERIDITLGHSLGEYAALVAGGYLEYGDALRMVRRRAEVMMECSRRAAASVPGTYGMVALVCEPDQLPTLIEAIQGFLTGGGAMKQDSADDVVPIEQVTIANINSKNQIVLSGNIERIKTLLTHIRSFAGHDSRAVRLKTDSPFHSPLMQPAADLMRHLLSQLRRAGGGGKQEGNPDIVTFPAAMPCVSNVSARPFASREDLKDLLARQCVETVRWWDSIRYVDQEEQVRRWVGIGPGKVGRNLVGKEVGMRGTDLVKGGGVWAICDPREVEDVLKALDKTEDKGGE